MSKRPENPSNAEASGTPIKRARTDSDTLAGPSNPTVEGLGGGGGGGGGGNDEVSSSPAVGRDTDSPSHRAGNRGKRGRGGNKDGGGGGRGGGRDRGGRGGGRGGRGGDSRSWGGRSDNAKGGMRTWGKKEGEEGADVEEKKERYPKKKVAVLIGYNGVGYFGSQINPGFETIEGVIFAALVKAGAISEDNSVNPQKVNLSRAARTDAGVCAAVNILSLKLIVAPPNMPAEMALEDYLNTFLPPSIRIWAILRVQGGFDPRHGCDQRHYEYTLPTHSFLGPKPGTAMHDWVLSSRSGTSSSSTSAVKVDSTVEVGAEAIPAPAIEEVQVEVVVEVSNSTDGAVTATGESEPAAIPSVETASIPIATLTPAASTSHEPSISETIATEASNAFWASLPADSTFAQDCEARKGWRISTELLESARNFVKAYEGSHNYYNYTVGKDFRDRSCQRVMRELKISDPFIVNGTELVAVTFLGQSFMLHQIRKMIGVAILAIRTSTPPSLIPETFGPSRIHTPKAPALGLLLLEPQYVEYNKRLVESNAKLLDLAKNGNLEEDVAKEQCRDPVEMGEGEIKLKVEEFKKQEIYKKMWEIEESGNVYANWLNYLDVHTGPDFQYLNSKGIIPEAAIFKKGENAERVRSSKGEEVVVIEEEETLVGAEEEG